MQDVHGRNSRNKLTRLFSVSLREEIERLVGTTAFQCDAERHERDRERENRLQLFLLFCKTISLF